MDQPTTKTLKRVLPHTPHPVERGKWWRVAVETAHGMETCDLELLATARKVYRDSLRSLWLGERFGTTPADYRVLLLRMAKRSSPICRNRHVVGAFAQVQGLRLSDRLKRDVRF